jgi:glycosyltransferase involved in cell wall biosynthesis
MKNGQTSLVFFQRLYVRAVLMAWRVHPGILFDRQYYLSNHPDVARSGIVPLFHFLRYGAAEGRKPHPLFDPRYYLEKYPDVGRSGHNPFLHFLRFGSVEGRQPHPDFDATYYRDKQDAAAKNVNPLVHFLQYGAPEGRLPHPDFNPEFYLAVNPDVAAANMCPVLHFARFGAAEGRLTRPRFSPNPPPECFLPARSHASSVVPDRPIDVVIPAYKGVSQTEACIASVLFSKCLARFRIVVINDNSPEPELTGSLRRLALDQKITLIEQPKNRGFVRSANTGIEAGENDVVLLNSDTLVFDGWLDRLAACAYSEQRTGTVTPFSNNATICSYPVFCADNRLPPDMDSACVDAACAVVNRGRSIDIPTAVGFCMYIRRDCLHETGLFDAESFGLGYGEENDFCMRAASKGWAHKLACDVFVHHAGGVSFGDSAVRQQSAMRILTKKHPAYLGLVRQHVQANPANGYRIALTAHRLRHSGKRVFLSIVHPLGGGLAQHARQLMASTANDVIWLNLKPKADRRLILECDRDGYQFSMALEPGLEDDLLATVLKACGVERIHIHHLMGHDADLGRLVRDLQIPFDFTVHDYYTVCPQVTLTDEHGGYCGEPDERACNHCMARRPAPGGVADITSWRAKYSWVLTEADRVIAPSADAGARIQKYYPHARVIAAEHESDGLCTIPSARAPRDGEPLRIAVLGAMATHKGFELLRDCSASAESSGIPVQFILVGSIEAGLARDSVAFMQTGSYEAADLAALVQRVAPHIVWFPARWPETFSYTLSASLELGLPVAAHRIGAFSERLGGRPWTWIVPPDWTAPEWVNFFGQVRRDNIATGASPAIPFRLPRALPDFYPVQYLKTANRPLIPSAPQRNMAQVSIAAAVASDNNGQIQACGYIRIIQPLTHPALSDTIRLSIVKPSSLITSEASVILVQRDAVQDLETAERIVQACSRRGARLIYEIDDDLFHIPPDHPDCVGYLQVAEAMSCIAAAADAIIVSTEALRQRMLSVNANTVPMPNYLDDRLWKWDAREARFDAKNIRILYAGTVSHRDDLELLGRAFRKVKPALRNNFHLNVVGITGASESNDWFEPIPVPPFIAASYPRFVEWIQSRNVWHWGVAPLLDTPFNRSKSSLKFLEYAALGIPSICSDVGPYREAVRHKETGLLFGNDPQEWAHGLETMAQDAELWTRLRSECRSVFCENTFVARAQCMRSQWMALVSGRAASATAREGLA